MPDRFVAGYSDGCRCISDAVVMLLNKTDDKKLINSSNNDNRSTLHIAAITNNVRLCKLLIAKGAKNNTPMKHKVFEGLYMYSVITLGSRNMMFEFHNYALKF